MFNRGTIAPQTDGTPSQVGHRPTTGRRKVAYLLLGAGSILAIGWLTGQGKDPEAIDRTRVSAASVGEVGQDFVPAPPPPPSTTPASVAAGRSPEPKAPGLRGWVLPTNLGPAAPPPPIAVFQAGGAGRQQGSASATHAASEGDVETVPAVGGGDRLDHALGSGRDGGTVSATVLKDRHLTMTMGTPIPCVLEQPIDTQVPGPFRCKVPGAVYGTSGAVPLLDPGTWVVGRVAQPVERGMDRAFAVVTRLETPQGCLVKLRAPIGDQLGTPGIEGEVDTHFWERFRGFAMIALLDAAGQAAALAAANAVGGDGGVTFNQFQGVGRSLGEGSFGDDIDIPPTLRTAQARRILVMVMDDIDMGSCFSLRTTQ